ncbi:MAG: hypothetical protein U9R37_01295 [Campylobacterota bacterium]|nr:hypothetical protein [Campylobacterota bacterium]
MDDLTLTSDELKLLFKNKEIIDTNEGWFYKGKEVEIFALHEIEPKYIQDMARAQRYRIKVKQR